MAILFANVMISEIRYHQGRDIEGSQISKLSNPPKRIKIEIAP